MAKSRKRGKGKKGKKARLSAGTADKYALYQASVQEPDVETKFFRRVYRKEFRRDPLVLREDFCGTGAVLCEWVKGGADRRAVGVDIDPEPMEWGQRENLSKLAPEQRERVEWLQADVRDVTGPKADVVAAENFSYFVFKTRDELRSYLEAARDNLAEQGVFVTDIMGGSECFDDDHEEERKLKGFTYVWKCDGFDAISHECQYSILFRFRDGSEMDAFSYEWRLWTLPELIELMKEAGFSRVDVYWEGEDKKTGEGNGVYRKRKSAPPDPCFVSYVVGVK